jgi:glycogen synthase
MKLAFCVRALYPQHGYGGLERAATAQVRHLLRLDTDVTLFTQPLPPGMPFAAGEEARGKLRVRPVRYGTLPLRPNGIPARLTNYRAFVENMGRRVRSAALRGDYGGAYAHGLCVWGLREARAWGLTLVANPHGLEEFKVRDPLKRLAYAPFRAWVRAGCRAADRVVATDLAMRDEVARLLGIGTERVVVIPSGVDCDEARGYVNDEEQARIVVRWPALEPGGAGFVGISVGRLEANKGFGDLIDALALAAPDLGDSWAWVLVGEGSLMPELQARAASLGLRERVLFAGGVSDETLHNLYARADLFAHPSHYEGSSLVTLEAMCHALPVVASRVGGIPDKVSEGETGHLIEPGDVRALAQHIINLSGSPGRGKEMGARGADRVAGEFSWARSMERLLVVFSEVAEERVACRSTTGEGLLC